MAKEIIALSIEAHAVRGVRIVANREAWVRASEGEVWSLDPLPTPESEEGVVAEVVLAEDDQPLVRAFRAAKQTFHAQEVVLSFPLSRLMTSVLKLPVDARDDLAGAVALHMDKISPFPGEQLAVGYEIVRESEEYLWIFVAALPEVVSDAVGDALMAVKLHVRRTDTTALGWFRSLFAKITEKPCRGRRVVLLDLDAGWDLFVLDQDIPVLLRGLGEMPDVETLSRELMLSLMNVEMDFGRQAVEDVVVVSHAQPDAAMTVRLEAMTGAQVRHVVPSDDYAGVDGVAQRTVEATGLDVTPALWRFALKMHRIRKQVTVGVLIAMTIWAGVIGWLFGTPFMYQQLTNRQKSIMRSHSKAYKAVSDTRERVNLVLSYTDRAKSALEVMLLLSDNLPAGVTLLSFQYKKDEGVRISGEAEQPTLVYTFKNALTACERFAVVTLTGPSASRGKHKFDIDCQFNAPEPKDDGWPRATSSTRGGAL